MRVNIRTNGLRLYLPVPAGLVGFAVRCVPGRVFRTMREKTPEPYRDLVTKEQIRLLLRECLELVRENKGLEIVHVEAADGTFVSVRL